MEHIRQVVELAKHIFFEVDRQLHAELNVKNYENMIYHATAKTIKIPKELEGGIEYAQTYAGNIFMDLVEGNYLRYIAENGMTVSKKDFLFLVVGDDFSDGSSWNMVNYSDVLDRVGKLNIRQELYAKLNHEMINENIKHHENFDKNNEHEIIRKIKI